MEAEKKPWRVTIGVTIEKDILDMIKQKAQDSDRSVSRYINWVLREHLKETDGN
ncbi:MAG: toxin-antitoxin system protein [Ruminococcaceae bacterium]|nr:toxin-antitoxin system protein [Oscillospiraceae bacterium]